MIGACLPALWNQMGEPQLPVLTSLPVFRSTKTSERSPNPNPPKKRKRTQHYGLLKTAVSTLRTRLRYGGDHAPTTQSLPSGTPDIGDHAPTTQLSSPEHTHVSTAAESLISLKIHPRCQEHEQPSSTRGSPSPKSRATMTEKLFEERIEMLRTIHFEECTYQPYLAHSRCGIYDCPYSSGDFLDQRFALMKRLYQINVALYGRVKERHINKLELLKTLIGYI